MIDQSRYGGIGTLAAIRTVGMVMTTATPVAVCGFLCVAQFIAMWSWNRPTEAPLRQVALLAIAQPRGDRITIDNLSPLMPRYHPLDGDPRGRSSRPSSTPKMRPQRFALPVGIEHRDEENSKRLLWFSPVSRNTSRIALEVVPWSQSTR